MRVIVQVTCKFPNQGPNEIWFDLMKVPETVNDLRGFLENAKKDLRDRKVRIVQILEE